VTVVDRVAAILPGLALAVAVAIVARLAAGLTAPYATEIPIAVALGLLAGNALPLGGRVAAGLRHVVRRWLRVGIVLLGAQLSFGLVLEQGLASLGLVVALVVLTLAFVALASRLLRIDGRTSLLIGVGTAICGNTAILAAAPLVGARDREVSFAVATITLFGTLAVLAYPALGAALSLSQGAFGVWAGTAVNDTSQVVATGFAYGQEAGEVATVVKLTRNLMLAPVLFAIALHASRAESGKAASTPRYRDALPLFVLGFVAMAALNSTGILDPQVAGRTLAGWSAEVARLLILVALAGVGLSTRLGALREVGPRPLYLGLAGAGTLAVTSLAIVSGLGLGN
jgi:uncharacterized integral membrane protein (TIGR00698 family)